MTTANDPLEVIIKSLPKYDPYEDSEGYYFDPVRAQAAIDWIEYTCTFTAGECAGRPFKLEWWQKALVALVFGWYSVKRNIRRYREILIYVPRKNGKTELMAAINNYILFVDGEPAAQIYSVAAAYKQAAIVWETSKLMIKNSPLLLDNCFCYTKTITHDATNSFYMPFTAEEKTAHGLNAHSVTVDELHACDEKTVVVMETSQGARVQPLFWYTTTADFDRPESICNKTHVRAKKIRDGHMKDPAFLPAIFEAEKEDDWHSVDTWKKANPNYGISIQIDIFMRDYNKACNEPSFENTFKRLRLNMKTEQSRRWIELGLWDKCAEPFDRDLENFRGARCYGGLDLASTTDTACFLLMFPDLGFKIIPFFFIPEATATEKSKTDRVPYRQWEKDGLITLTPGIRIDFAFIKAKIIEVCDIVDMVALGFDPYAAVQLSLDLTENHDIPMMKVRQGYITMNEPCKRIETDMATGILSHGGNPIMREHAANVSVREDPAGNIKIDKEKSFQKVDGMSALADAYACYLASDDDDSVYNERGMLSFGVDDGDDSWKKWADE